MTNDPRDRPTRRRLLVYRLLTALAAAAVGYALVQAAVRAGWLPRGGYQDYLRQRAYDRAAGRPTRLLVLGDSHLDHWPLARSLRRSLARYSERRQLGLVVEAGGGWGPQEYRRALVRRLNQRYGPQLVVLFYNVANDAVDAMRAVNEPVPPGLRHLGPVLPTTGSRLAPDLAPAPRARAWRWPALPLPLLSCGMEQPQSSRPTVDGVQWERLRHHGIDPQLLQQARASIRNPDRVGDELVSASLLVGSMANPKLFIQAVLMEGFIYPYAWNSAKVQLATVAAQLRQWGGDLRVVVIPAMVQVSAAQRPFLQRARFTVRDALFSSTLPQQKMLAFCRAQKISCLDLLPLLRAHPRPQKLFLLNDDHLSEQGHRAIFAEVQKRVLDPWLRRNQQHGER